MSAIQINFIRSIEATRALIFKGDLIAAEKSLQTLLPQSPAEVRWLDHFKGIILMRKGLFDEAILIFLNTIQKNGNHLGVILDLAACYRATHQAFNWQETVSWASFEFKKNQMSLQDHQLVKITLLLSKFTEEKGELNESWNHYSELLEFIRNKRGNIKVSQYEPKVLSQLVRMQGQYGFSSHGFQNFEKLINHCENDTDVNSDFEVQHALCLFELENLGPKAAYARISRLAKNPILDSAEQDWFFADLLFEYSVRGLAGQFQEQFPDRWLMLQILSQKQADIEIAGIFRILDHCNFEINNYLELVNKCTPAARLRFLNLWSLHSQDPYPVKAKSILISTLSRDSAQIWEKYFTSTQQYGKKHEISIQLNPILSCVNLLGSLEVTKLTYSSIEILSLFAERQSFSLDEIIEQLWHANNGDSDIQRLRMRISRMNQDLKMKLGITKAFSMNKFKVETKIQIVLVYK